MKKRLNFIFWCVGASAAAILLVFLLGRKEALVQTSPSVSSKVNTELAPAFTQNTGVEQTSASKKNDVGPPQIPLAKSPSTSAGLKLTELSRHRTSREVVETARRTNDAELYEYAIGAVTYLCLTQQRAEHKKKHVPFGLSNADRTNQVLAQLWLENQAAQVAIQERCSDYESVDSLRRQLHAEASRAEMPLAKAAYSLNRVSSGDLPTSGMLVEARRNLDLLLAGSNAPNMVILLITSTTPSIQGRLSKFFPNTSENDWPLGPSIAAYHIAACRVTPSLCSSGSMERDTVCARYGECREPDVEASYRRLFDLYGIPFADTDRLAAKLQQAIVNRDAAALLP